MASGAIWYPGIPPGAYTNSAGGTAVLGHDVTPSVAGVSITGVYFYKAATNTGTHVATVYNATTQANLGSATFTGETASGWQFVPLTPIALTSGQAYRVTMWIPTSRSWMTGFTGFTGAMVAMSSTAYSLLGATSGFPTTTAASVWQGIDVQFDGLPAAPPLRTSQAMAETWEVGNPSLATSQATTEVWLGQGLFLVTSQITGETWLYRDPAISVSQVLAEVWATVQAAPVYRRYRESQGVT